MRCWRESKNSILAAMASDSEISLRKIFSQRLQLSRKKAGLTQEQLAERIGKSVDLVSRLERATTSPSFETISLIAEALNSPAASFFTHEEVSSSDRHDVYSTLIDLVLSMPLSDTVRTREVLLAMKK
ncbi:helix-turn-helix domain-containing protein [Ponticaulis sp.]|uniref:helix-turn-helix domain-containing protein n=1 Tax=Ponticaulis sp. TaxID=2020902 RepID=UPI000B64CDA6|nr:hypothetical protein [Ponticaulis sp.]OUY01207.1 MAG: hypothetical protein CBB65_01855 [Hyphomonadaceae bacterium TMED5]